MPHLSFRIDDELFQSIEEGRGKGKRAPFIKGILLKHFQGRTDPQESPFKAQWKREIEEVEFLRERIKHLEVLLGQAQTIKLPDKSPGFLDRLKFW